MGLHAEVDEYGAAFLEVERELVDLGLVEHVVVAVLLVAGVDVVDPNHFGVERWWRFGIWAARADMTSSG